MQIIDTHLEFKDLTSRLKTSRLVVHHSASQDVPAAEIHKWHLQRGFSGIGYHYLIRTNGTVEISRPVSMEGAHAQGFNADSIGVCMTGNFMQTSPSREQLSALTELVLELNLHYGPLQICRHSDLNPTDCPGVHFPWNQFRRELNRLEPKLDQQTWKNTLVKQSQADGLISGDHHPDDLAPKWFVLAVALNLRRIR
ncbi:MAG: N-acetylmuramoyl-L-alanine amidase [Syntrophomonadaceae bacterium]